MRLRAAAEACVSQTCSWRPDRRVGTFPPGAHQWSDQAVASTSSSLHLSTRRTFWTHTLVMFDICTDVHFDSHLSVWLPIVDTFVWGDLTKHALTIESVDRFYLNLVICLQLDIALLIQNAVKVWHCLPELWQCIRGRVTFYRTQCIDSCPNQDWNPLLPIQFQAIRPQTRTN